MIICWVSIIFGQNAQGGLLSKFSVQFLVELGQEEHDIIILDIGAKHCFAS